MLFYAGDVEIQTTAGINVNAAPLSIQPATPSRAMRLGDSLSAGTLQLTNVELARIFTTNSLTLGGVNTATLTVDGILLNNNASVVNLWAQSTSDSSLVQFISGVSNFTQPLDVRSASSITISTNLTALSSPVLVPSWFTSSSEFTGSVTGSVLSLMADSDCNRVGNVTIDTLGSVRSSNRPLLIQSHDIDIGGFLMAGTSFVRIGSCPSAPRTINVGGSGLGLGDLRVSEFELSLISAANLTIQTSGTGSSIQVFTVVVADVSTISDKVTLDASSTGSSINFVQTTEWRGLTALAGSGMTINGNISTTISSLWLDGNADYIGVDTISLVLGSLWLTASGGLSSRLVLQPSQLGSITAVAPVYWSATNGIHVMAATSILSGSGVVRLLSDSDTDGQGLLLFGAAGALTVNIASCRFDAFIRNFSHNLNRVLLTIRFS